MALEPFRPPFRPCCCCPLGTLLPLKCSESHRFIVLIKAGSGSDRSCWIEVRDLEDLFVFDFASLELELDTAGPAASSAAAAVAGGAGSAEEGGAGAKKKAELASNPLAVLDTCLGAMANVKAAAALDWWMAWALVDWRWD